MRFWAIVAATFVVLAVICGLEPPLGDGWTHHVNARAPLTWDGFIESVVASYELGNPRWGQIPLALSYRTWLIPALVTPLAIVGGLICMMALLRARWPDPRDPADARLFVRTLAAALATTPQFGGIWFYRPICTNYMYPLALHLLWLVPYRFLADRPPRTKLGSLALAVAIIPLGFVAGAGNEHTAPCLAAGAVLCMAIAWRRDRKLPLWSVLGLLALAAGAALLLTAPGQSVRYAGIAAQQSSVFEPILERGLVGNLRVLALLLAWASPMVLVVAVCARAGGWTWTPAARRQVLAYLALGAIVFGTSLLSPRLAPRLLLMSSTMIALALGVVMLELDAHERARRWLHRACTAIVCTFAAASLVLNVPTGIEGRARTAMLDAAKPGDTVHVEPYTMWFPTPFSWGDDFRNRGMRVRVVKKLELADIIYP